MNGEKINEQNKSFGNWAPNLILGVTYIAVSIWVFSKPEAAYVSFAKVFSIALLFTGTLEIISFFQNREYLNENGFYFTIGILDILVSISIIVISRPQAPTEALTLIIGYVLLYRTVKLITWSTEMKYYDTRNLGWVLFGFVTGTVFSFFLIWDRAFSPKVLLFFASFVLLMIGISEICFSFVLKKLRERGKLVSMETESDEEKLPADV